MQDNEYIKKTHKPYMNISDRIPFGIGVLKSFSSDVVAGDNNADETT